MKKRIISAFLVLCMLTCIFPTAAFAEDFTIGSVAESVSLGELEIIIKRGEASAQTEFNIKLTNEENGTVSERVLNAGKNEKEVSACMLNVADGAYTLEISAQHYLTYTQKLDFNGRRISLTLYNYTSVNDEMNGKMFGVFPVGDLNNDGSIDEADADKMVEEIEKNNAAFDITGDGKTDLKDLAVVVRNEKGMQEATPVHSVSSSVLKSSLQAKNAENTGVEGELQNLFTPGNESVVGLKPGNGEEQISAENPVEIEIEKPQNESTEVKAQAIVITPPTSSTNSISEGEITVEGTDENGNDVSYRAIISENGGNVRAQGRNNLNLLRAAADASGEIAVYENSAASVIGAVIESDGTIVVDLGTRVAIKKITIRVTATANQGNLAEIAKVEFLSDFEERIPEVQLSKPTVLSVSNTESDGLGYKNLTVSWDRQTNVTGYEVSVSGNGYNKTATAAGTTYTFQGDSFNGTVKSFQTYTIRVRSVSGTWRSAWSEPYEYTVTCRKAPPAPQYLSAVGAAQALNVSWNCQFDAEWFSLYYKAADESEYTVVNNIGTDSYTIENLRSGVTYTMYVVAYNRNGASPKSNDAEGTPISASGVEMPKYRLINTVDENGKAMTHISSISGVNNKSYTIYRADGTSVKNGEATAADWEAIADNNPNSYLYIDDWDSGVAYANFRGPIIQLDGKYEIDTIRLSPSEGATALLNAVKVRYKDEAGEMAAIDASVSTKYDSMNRRYFEAVLNQPITTDYLEIGTSTGYTRNYTIAEVKLYYFDDIEVRVADLFEDDMHVVLKDDVTKADIETLTERANTRDEISGELHPHLSAIMADLNYALQLLEDKSSLAEVFAVDNQITAVGNPNSGFAQTLSDYQPLGFVAAAGDTIVIYVSDDDGKTAKGTNVNLKLVATQYHPEVSSWQAGAVQLKAGRNEIAIPKIGSYAKEAGGSLYLQYTGQKGANNYSVRVSGGTKIPVLNLDGITGEARNSAIEAYVKELEDYVNALPNLHENEHAASSNSNVSRYEYQENECFLNATEITLENMMYSVPATQVWAVLKNSENPTGQLSEAVAAMEQEIEYFYQFKGMNKAATDNDAYPYTRLNIRYHQMFTGAFMYAGGKHIGIEWGSVGELFGITPLTTDADGKKLGGRLTGWGISHEIGHCINAAAYQRVEVTNNVFAMIAKTDETNSTFRTNYQNVYKALATGTSGHTGDLAVQLAKYWQLHLAYDNDYTFKLYDSIDEQQAGLFYARVESYLREPSKASPALKTASGDQGLMQAACAAANKDILEFFEAWGLKPSAETKLYAKNFEKETRKIQYIDDDSRLYRISGGEGMSSGTTVSAEITNANASRINGSRVEISLGNTNKNNDAMLGYEIRRNGDVIAFVTADEDSFTDVVTTENNKVLVYTVTGIDRLLQSTKTVALDEVKICHDGAIGKDGWTAYTNASSPNDTVVEKDDENPESGSVNGSKLPGMEIQSEIGNVIDNDLDTVYYGTGSGSNRPYILLDLGGVEQVAALKFTPASENYSGNAGGESVNAEDLFKYRIFGYKIEISTDGENWTTVKSGDSYTGNAGDPSSWVKQNDIIYNADGSYTMYFNKELDNGDMDPFMYIYDAAYVKLTATNMSAIAVAEIDILGPTNDNVELDTFGKLAQDYRYADGEGNVIPAGSAVFFGSYKGDPSYNVVLLKDQNGDVIDGSQIILADVPETGALGETSDGRWIFWLEDKTKTDDLGEQYNEFDRLGSLESVIVELYRVQDATTLEGQRLTSTSLRAYVDSNSFENEVKIVGGSGSRVFVPSEDMFLAAKEYRASGNLNYTDDIDSVRYASGEFYGDTGAAQLSEPSKVKLQNESESKVSFTVKPEDTSIALQLTVRTEPAASEITVDAENADGNLFRKYTYNAESGELNLYTVAKHGCIGGNPISGTMSGLTKESRLIASLTEIDSIYDTVDGGSCDITVSGDANENPTPGSSGGFGVSQHTLRFDTNGGNKLASISKRSGTTIDLSDYVPERDGYDFVGWYSDSELTKQVTSVKLTKDIIVYAKWNVKQTELPNTPEMPKSIEEIFADIDSEAWYKDDAAYVYSKGLMKGTSEDQFSPDLSVTRGMIATILYRLENEPAVSEYSGFDDVAPGSYYENAVKWAAMSGIAEGFGDGSFRPEEAVTREQAAVMLYRYAKAKELDMSVNADLSKYTDVETVSAYAAEAMMWANAAGLINGTDQMRLEPADGATRAQTAAILHRFCEYIAGQHE